MRSMLAILQQVTTTPPENTLEPLESFVGGLSVLIAIYAAATIVYWLPSLVGAVRRCPFMVHVLVMNGLAGWTVIGWILAFRIALDTGTRTSSLPPRRYTAPESPPPPPPPGWYPAGPEQPSQPGPGYDPRRQGPRPPPD